MAGEVDIKTRRPNKETKRKNADDCNGKREAKKQTEGEALTKRGMEGGRKKGRKVGRKERKKGKNKEI